MKALRKGGTVKGGPVARPPQEPEWIWGENALERSAGALAKLPGPYLLVGESKLLSPLRKRISGAWIEAGLEIQPLSFPEGSECCEEQARAIAAVAGAKEAKTLIAWGGGKCMDAVKWAGMLSGRAVATVPTCASTCACATRVVVAHSPSGQVLDLVELSSAPDLCIADFELLRSAPDRTLRAGMADTLAKWLEWSAVGEIEGPGAAEARQAYDIVMEASPSDEKIWEANLRLSARASNQGDAPAAAAHSFCAGISMMPASRQWLHGEWVGLGLLFQQQLCGDTDTDQGRLKEWLKGLGLPTALPFTLEDPGMIAERIAQDDESIWQMARAQDLGIGSIAAALGSLSR